MIGGRCHIKKDQHLPSSESISSPDIFIEGEKDCSFGAFLSDNSYQPTLISYTTYIKAGLLHQLFSECVKLSRSTSLLVNLTLSGGICEVLTSKRSYPWM